MMSRRETESSVLGRILLFQSALHLAHDDAALAEMTVHGLADIPGVANIRFLYDQQMPAQIVGSPAPHGAQAAGGPAVHTRAFPLRTSKAHYGTLLFDIGDPRRFEPYAPFASNTANLIALQIENRRIGADLQQANERLSRLAEDRAHRYKELFESSRDALMTIAPPDWRFVDANRAALELFGAESLGEFTAILPWQVSPDRQPDGSPSQTAAREMIARTMTQGSHSFEWLHRSLAGREFTADVLLTRLETPEGVLIQATVRDISERIRTVDALKASQAFYRMAGRSARMGAWSVELAGMRVIWSDEVCDILQVPRDSPLTLEAFIRFYTPSSRARMAEAISRCQTAGTPFDEELQLITAAGRLLTVRALGEAIYDESGLIVRLQGSFQDISTIKAYDAALHESRESMRLFIEHAPSAIAMFDCDMRYLAVSRRWIEDYRLTDLEILGRSHYEVFPEIPERWKDAHRRALSGEVLTARDDCFERRDGSRQWVNWETRPWYRASQAIGGIVLFTEDITQRKRAQESLLQSERKYRSLFENMNIGFMLFEVVQDAQGVPVDLIILAANKGFERTTGLRLTDVLGKRLTEALPGIERDDADWIGLYGQVAVTGVACQFERRSSLLGTTYAISAYQPAPRQCSVTFQDVTERKKSESELRIAATAFQVQEGIIVTDADERILKVNEALTRITGYPASECIGKTPRMFSSGRQDQRFYKDMWQRIRATGRWEGEVWNRRKNGETYPERLSITAVRDTEGKITHYVGNFSDITMNLAAAEEIHDLAFNDALTHLPNRRLFMDRLHQVITSSARSGQKGALFLLDLDNFKTVNDTLGHHTGDSLLRQVAERIAYTVREGDTVARLGGDEFVALIPDLGVDVFEVAEKAKEMGNKLLTSLNRPFRLGDDRFHNTPSVGVTIVTGRETAEELMKQADIAMYHAKRAEKNTLRFFDQQMQHTVNAQAALERDLRIALDQQQFELYYQVQVDRVGKAIGAEALIRWNHPAQGMISPAHFIPVAEESNLILGIGDWVLEAACARLAAWSRTPATRDLILSVNVSSRQIRHPDFVAKLESAIARHRVAVDRLKIEITETMLLENSDATIRVLDRLSTIGLRLALDDFGTGYSSLSYLKRLPIDQLKIDQSFVREMVTDPDDLALIRTIIAMAYNLKIDTIAEGVETDEQRQLLAHCGCSAFQGYLFGRPMPSGQFEDSLAKP